MMTALDFRALRLAALAAALLLPAAAFGQASVKFTKDSGVSAQANAGCWPDGTTNFSDSGPGQYDWSLTVSDDILASVIAAADTATEARLVFSDSGNVATTGTGTAAEGTTASPALVFTVDGTPISVGAGASTPTGCSGCVRTWTVDIDGALLTALGLAACGQSVTIDISLFGDASAGCGVETNGHGSATWRGQGVYPGIKPRLFYDGSLTGC